MSRLTKVGLVALLIGVAWTVYFSLGFDMPFTSDPCPEGFYAGNCGDADFTGLAYVTYGVLFIALALAVLAVAGIRRLIKGRKKPAGM